MRTETVDKSSGAILFKKTKETRDIEYLMKKVKDLESRVVELENELKKKKEDS